MPGKDKGANRCDYLPVTSRAVPKLDMCDMSAVAGSNFAPAAAPCVHDSVYRPEFLHRQIVELASFLMIFPV